MTDARAASAGVHNFIEFHPLANWHAVVFGMCLAQLVAGGGGANSVDLPASVRRALYAVRAR
jgi:hypothetical protein